MERYIGLFFYIWIFFSFYGSTCGIWKFLGQGLNQSHIWDLCHSSFQQGWILNSLGEARNLTHILTGDNNGSLTLRHNGNSLFFGFLLFLTTYTTISFRKKKKKCYWIFCSLPSFPLPMSKNLHSRIANNVITTCFPVGNVWYEVNIS